MSKTRRRVLWVDEETAARLEAIADQIEAEIGFRPTQNQLIKNLLREHDRRAPPCPMGQS